MYVKGARLQTPCSHRPANINAPEVALIDKIMIVETIHRVREGENFGA